MYSIAGLGSRFFKPHGAFGVLIRYAHCMHLLKTLNMSYGVKTVKPI